ncbi:MAG: response regulator transcription factor [Bacteroidetes bacterium]|nr:response regulator transcription factor [Bacteroidota bacterium]
MIEQSNETPILLADDHPLMRKGLKEMIEEEGGFKIIAETNNGESALALIEQHHPMIALLDIDMPKMNGLEVAEAVRKKKLQVRIIILTMYDTENMFSRAMELGVKGYVLKESAATEIVDALKNVREGKHYITPALSGLLVRRSERQEFHADEQFGLSQLTSSERKILKLISLDKSSKEIAEELFVSPRTVDTHRSNICQKLKLHGPTSLFKFAMDNKHLL